MKVDDVRIDTFKEEWRILKAFDSPFILKQYGQWDEISYVHNPKHGKRRIRALYSVLDLCERGDLYDLLNKYKKMVRPALARYYFASLVLGLEYAQKHHGSDHVF